MNTKHAVMLGCGLLLLVAVAAIAGVAGFLYYFAEGVKNVSVDVNVPEEVVVGDVFDLEVTVSNDRAKQGLEVSDVDISEEYLAGFTIVSVMPKSKSNMHVPLANSRSYTFDLPVKHGETKTFSFKLRAEKPGIYCGDVDVCEGLRPVTAQAETVVKAKQ